MGRSGSYLIPSTLLIPSTHPPSLDASSPPRRTAHHPSGKSLSFSSARLIAAHASRAGENLIGRSVLKESFNRARAGRPSISIRSMAFK